MKHVMMIEWKLLLEAWMFANNCTSLHHMRCIWTISLTDSTSIIIAALYDEQLFWYKALIFACGYILYMFYVNG